MITFVTSDNGLSYAAITRETKRVYCERYGYKFYAETFGADVNPYWEQVRIMKDVLAQCEEGDWINYTGADAFILKDAPPCDSMIEHDCDLIISTDVNGLNNNGFFLKNSEWGRVFIEKVWALKSDEKIAVSSIGDGLVVGQHEWFEQAAFVVVLRDVGLERVLFVDKKEINSYPWDKEPGNFIVHLPGRSDEERTAYFAHLNSPLTVEQSRRLAWLERKSKTYLDESERIQLEGLRNAGL